MRVRVREILHKFVGACTCVRRTKEEEKERDVCVWVNEEEM